MKLWKEYAIEPSLFANYHLGNEILSGIGTDNGRIVGALPRRWQREVRRATVGQREIERLRILERLVELRDAIVARPYQWDGERAWREQVFEVHDRGPFDGILLDGPDNRQNAIDATLGLAGVQCWVSDRTLTMPRIGATLAQVLKPILSLARTVIVVDAYFDPSRPLRQSKWLRPLQALCAVLPEDGRLTRFEAHALNPRDLRRRWEAGTFAASCRNNLGAALPPGIRINAMLWGERDGGVQFHERLIVTDVGGVVVDPGIDEGLDGETYTVRLLSNREIPAYLAKFAPATAPFDLVENEEVIGT